MSDQPGTRYALGDSGAAVLAIRERLVASGELAPGSPGSPAYDAQVADAVRAFQQRRGIRVDGIVGPTTWLVLDGSRWQLGDRLLAFTPGHLTQGDDVADLQTRLMKLGFGPDRVDGIFGSSTDRAVSSFQRDVGVDVTGTIGPDTLRAFNDLARSVSGGEPGALRERELVRRSGHNLAGRTVVIDPGHGGPDLGAVGRTHSAAGDPDIAESDVVLDLARRIEGRLSAVGVTVLFTRGNKANPSTLERASIANEAAADVLLSLHCDAIESPAASGVATYYYGADGVGAGSAVSAHLAGLIQREIVARTALPDCRSHARAWTVLQRSTMPAVLVEVGYLSSPLDSGRLAEPEFRDLIAEAIAVALQRMYLGDDDTTTTGVFDLRQLRDRMKQLRSTPT